jgi:predicted dehydrogenase
MTAAGLALAVSGRQVSAQDSIMGANERVNLGLIGCGNRGRELLSYALLAKNVGLPMVCDVDSKRAGQAGDSIEQAGKKKPVIVSDYRKLLASKDIHGVIICTPDHWHAIQYLHACASDKDVYVETPISHNIVESVRMKHITRRSRRVVQVGLQQRSYSGFNEMLNQVRSGKLGKVSQTRSWTFAKVDSIGRSVDSEPPAHLDYDRWLGPAPKRSFNPGRVHGHFSNWWDYGGGTMCNWNPHFMDVMNAAMRVNAPKSVVAIGGNHGLKDFRETPDTLEVVFEYEGVDGPFIHVYSLRLSNGHAAWGPPIACHNGQIAPDHTMHYGVQFHGRAATLFMDRHGSSIFPADVRQPTTIPKPAKEATGLEHMLTLDHLNNFINCVRTREEPKAPIETGVYALLGCQLANISYRLGKKIYYDTMTDKCYFDAAHKEPADEAAKLFFRTYREPYTPSNI